MTNEATMTSKQSNRWHRDNWGGGELGEALAYEDLCIHRATMVVGARVRAYRMSDVVGTITEVDGGHRVIVTDDDGLRFVCETHNLELL